MIPHFLHCQRIFLSLEPGTQFRFAIVSYDDGVSAYVGLPVQCSPVREKHIRAIMIHRDGVGVANSAGHVLQAHWSDALLRLYTDVGYAWISAQACLAAATLAKNAQAYAGEEVALQGRCPR